MPDPVFLSYVGAFTGVIGSVLGYVGYRQSAEMKAVDLRLQLGQGENELRFLVEHLPELMEFAKVSRTNVNAMGGQTGAQQFWMNSYSSDSEVAASLALQLPSEDAAYETLKPAALAEKVVTLHRLRLQADRLTDKYRASMAEDDRARGERRADMRVRGV